MPHKLGIAHIGIDLKASDPDDWQDSDFDHALETINQSLLDSLVKFLKQKLNNEGSNKQIEIEAFFVEH